MLPRSTFLIGFISFLVFPWPAPAFEMQPVGTEYDRQMARLDESRIEQFFTTLVDRGAPNFLAPVHEEITQRIYGCDEPWGDKPNCARKNFAPPAVIDGARWNDNPPFMVKDGFQLPNGEAIDARCANETIKLPRKSDCWLKVFKSSNERAQTRFFTNRTGVMLNRSHFGDMQFLHSMASRLGDRAQDTKFSILMWAEFAYKVAIGTIPANKMLKDVPVSHIAKKVFPNQEATVENLFLMGDETYRGQLKDFAFGALLHMIEDSFSESHVSRDLSTQGAACGGPLTKSSPAKIEKFLVYSSQDSGKHKDKDTYEALKRDAAKYSPNLIDVGKILLEFYKQKSKWEVVKVYLDECVWALKDIDAEADAGNFEKRGELSPQPEDRSWEKINQ